VHCMSDTLLRTRLRFAIGLPIWWRPKAMMAAASSACSTHFAAPSALQAPGKACELHRVSSLLAPFTPHCRKLHAGRHGLLHFPSCGFCRRLSACAGKQIGAFQEGGAQIPRRQLVLRGAGVLVGAAAGGLDKPAVATAVSSANLVLAAKLFPSL
jgi:hypothetical protein